MKDNLNDTGKKVMRTSIMKTKTNILTLSADPVAKMNSLYGLNDKQLTSAVCASTV